jgi:hypothetical protein
MHTDIIYRLRDAVRRKNSEKWETNSWHLIHDNTPAHWSVVVKDFLAKNNVTKLEHPPQSDMDPTTDFYHFP